MVKIGDIFVEISATTSKLRANLAQASSLIRDFSLLSQGLSSGIGEAFRQISEVAIRGLQMALLGLVGSFSLAAKTGADFEDEMIRAFTILQEGGNAVSDSLSRMTRTALNLGRETLFSAVQAAQGMQILARAGFDTREILDSIRPTLDLAIVGNMELAEATNITISALRGFNLETRKAADVADILALGSSKANTTIQELGTALSYVAPVAAGAGLSIEETVAAIGILSNAGIRGGRAGTTLRRALSQLLAPSGRAKKVMEELGVSFVSSEGRLKPFVTIIRDLQTAGMNASQAMEMFGLRAGPGMITLVNAGAGSIRDLKGDLEDAKGTAEDMSQAFRTTVKGRVRDLMASVIDLGLAFSERFKKPLSDAIFAVRNFIVDIVNIGNRMGIFKVIVEGVKNAMEPIIDLVKDWSEEFKKWLGTLTPRKVSEFFSNLKESVESFIESFREGEIGAIIRDTFEVVLGLGKQLLGLLQNISKTWMILPEGIRESIRPLLIISGIILKLFGGLLNIVFLFVSMSAILGSIGIKVTAFGLALTGVKAILLLISVVAGVIGSAIGGWSLGKLIADLPIVKGYFTSLALIAQSIGPSLKLAAMSMLAIGQPWRLLNEEFRKDMAETVEEIKLNASALSEIDWLGKGKSSIGVGKEKGTEGIGKGYGGGFFIGPSGEISSLETVRLLDEIDRLKNKISLERDKVGPGKITEILIDLVQRLIDKENRLDAEYESLNNRVNSLMSQTISKTSKAEINQSRINSGIQR